MVANSCAFWLGLGLLLLILLKIELTLFLAFLAYFHALGQVTILTVRCAVDLTPWHQLVWAVCGSGLAEAGGMKLGFFL